ncbi:MAG: hypothetical protein COA44_12250 [Arcobacter sp.]|nr:MAG: hypothetical protein COA44_12250 [Arcobacter sp.]
MRILILLTFYISLVFSYDVSLLVHQTPILDSIKKVHTLQSQAFDENALNTDEAMQKMLKENKIYLQNILMTIKDDPYTDSFVNAGEFEKRTAFLKSRILLNIKRGNNFAVDRDHISLGYLEQLQYLNTYIMSLSKMVRAYADRGEIKEFALKSRQNHKMINKEKFTLIYKSVLKDNNPIAQITRENFKAYITISETYDKLLEFTSHNPKLLSKKTIFTLINYDEIINSVNVYPSARWLNKHIGFLYLNTGKLISILVITSLFWISFYLSKWVLQFRIFNFKHYENRKLLRPIRLVLWVSALDYFFLTLIYPIQPSGFGESFIIFMFTLSTAYLLMELIAYVVIGYFETKQSSKNEKALVSLSIDILKTILAIAAFVYFLNKMGVGLETVLTSLGIFGLGIALAAKDSLANLFGSLNLLLDDTFSQGDFVSIGELEGEIVKVGLRSTQIRALDNSLIILPNAEANAKPIVNWSKRRLGREIKTSISISYSIKPQKLKDLIEEIRYMISQHSDLVQSDDITRHESASSSEFFVSKKNLFGLKKDRFVYLDKFDSSHLSILVQTFSRTIDREEWYKVKEDLLYSIWEILQKHEVEFFLPGQNIFLNRPSSKKISD